MDAEFNDKCILLRSFVWVTPKVIFEFSRYFQFYWTFVQALRRGTILLEFGRFVNSYFVLLHKFAEVFHGSSDWCITALRDDRTFFLIYRREYSILVALRPLQALQLIVPIMGPSRLLSIAMNGLPHHEQHQKAVHQVVSLAPRNLPSLKNLVEKLFSFIDMLKDMGFVEFKLNDKEYTGHYVCPRTFCASQIQCSVKSDRIDFEPQGDSVNKVLKVLLNSEFGTCEAKLAVVQFVIQLAVLQGKLLAAVIQFFAEMTTRAAQLEIDWMETMKSSCVTQRDNSVNFSFVGPKKCFKVRIGRKNDSSVEFNGFNESGAKKDFRTMKDVLTWVETLATL
jgi:hypothetical protein